jgi:hypothetical protein
MAHTCCKLCSIAFPNCFLLFQAVSFFVKYESRPDIKEFSDVTVDNFEDSEPVYDNTEVDASDNVKQEQPTSELIEDKLLSPQTVLHVKREEVKTECDGKLLKRRQISCHLYVEDDLVNSSDEEINSQKTPKMTSKMTLKKSKKKTESDSEIEIENIPNVKKKCPECSKTFKDDSQLQDHTAIVHQGFFPVQCKECDSGYANTIEHRKHFKEAHPDKDVANGRHYYCQFCDYSSTKGGPLRTHKMQVHLERTIPCDLCDMKFAYKAQVVEHKKWRHNAVKGHMCHECGKDFVKQSDLKKHIDQKHLSAKKACHICGYSFLTKDSLAYHYLKKHGSIPDNLPKDTSFFKCDKCDKFFRTEKYLAKHFDECQSNSSINEEKICTKCGITYSGMVGDHHCDILMYPCSICHQIFTMRSVCDEHELVVHKQEFNHTCEHCGKKFGLYQYLKGHVRRFHNIILPPLKNNPLLRRFICSLCNLPRPSKVSLSFHCKSVHGFLPPGVEEFPTYSCPQCKKILSSMKSMHLHVEKFHENPKMYCKRCHVSYRNDNHKCVRRLATMFKCSHCAKILKGPSSLEEHVKTKHELIFDFQCLICNWKRGTKTAMLRHLNDKHKLNRKQAIKDVHYKDSNSSEKSIKKS